MSPESSLANLCSSTSNMTPICQRVRALQGPCHRARCSKASHRPGPKIHYDLLRFCQHLRLAFLAQNVPSDVMMRPADAGFDPGRGDWGSVILQRSSAVPVLVQSSIVRSILQQGLGATFATLSADELAWCRVIVALPHHKVGLGITSLPASGMAAFYSATAHLVSWLGSLSHRMPPMGCWSESCRSHHLEQLGPSNPETASP